MILANSIRVGENRTPEPRPVNSCAGRLGHGSTLPAGNSPWPLVCALCPDQDQPPARSRKETVMERSLPPRHPRGSGGRLRPGAGDPLARAPGRGRAPHRRVPRRWVLISSLALVVALGAGASASF